MWYKLTYNLIYLRKSLKLLFSKTQFWKLFQQQWSKHKKNIVLMVPFLSCMQNEYLLPFETVFLSNGNSKGGREEVLESKISLWWWKSIYSRNPIKLITVRTIYHKENLFLLDSQGSIDCHVILRYSKIYEIYIFRAKICCYPVWEVTVELQPANHFT